MGFQKFTILWKGDLIRILTIKRGETGRIRPYKLKNFHYLTPKKLTKKEELGLPNFKKVEVFKLTPLIKFPRGITQGGETRVLKS